MSARIANAFARTRGEKRGLLVAYLCVGDPNVEASYEIARALLDAGADALELGAPFSDPTADGPTIARASMRAIAHGGSMRAAIEVGARLRKATEAPLVLFGYANPAIVMGERATVQRAADAGIDAMLLVDLPPEEGAELRDEARARGVDVIPLLTPTSEPSRVAAAKKVARGFVYYVSVAGITGAQKTSDPFYLAAKTAATLRGELGLPVVVGFGIDAADKARRALGSPIGSGADGVVVGTAIVRAIEEANGDVGKAREGAAKIVTAISGGLR